MTDAWIGGDLAGLQSMGTTMKSAPSVMDEVVKALSAKVDNLVSDAGWSGHAADTMRAAWTLDSIRAATLSKAVGDIGQVISDLGDDLQKVEADLFNYADGARTAGAQIGSDGKPLTLTPEQAADAKIAKAQSDYVDTYNSAMHVATGLRLKAKGQLIALGKPIVPPKPGDPTPQWDKPVVVGDYLRGLYTIPNEMNRKAITKASDAVTAASAHYDDEVTKWKADGLQLSDTHPAALGKGDALTDLANLESGITTTKELPASSALNVKLGDLGKALTGAKALPEGLQFLDDIPVVDVAASAAVAQLQVSEDTQKGEKTWRATAEDYGAAALGIAAGVGTTAALGASSPVWGTAALAGAAVIGVGDTAYQALHEHWTEDFTEHGGVGSGLLYGTANTFSNVGDDLYDTGAVVVNGVKSVWNKLF